MQKRRVLSLILTIMLCIGMIPAMSTAASAEDTAAIPIYLDPSYSFEERAADLVARMTTSQKSSQVYSQNTPAIAASQLGGGALNVPATAGVPSYTWWQEALHGYLNAQNSNNYPQNTSVGSTWNPDLYYSVASEIADEIRERAPKGATVSTDGRQNATNLNFYSPTVNMHRDPRWGRNEESYSEDVYLMSQMGTAFVQGMQGMDRNGNLLDPAGRRKLNPTLKHYVANNSERNRLDGGAATSLRALREYYAAPYRNIIQDADVSSIMTAYSTLNGDPCTWSSYLLDTLLRQIYGLSGHITGDCDSVSTISRHNLINPYTGKVLTTVEQLSQAMAHGMDLQCNGGHGSGQYTFASMMPDMISQAVETDKGRFTENQLDIAVHRLMTARMQTGEWDSDNIYTTQAAERVAEQSGSVDWQTPERLKLIDDVNAEAVVMLKNEAPAGSPEKILPLAVPASGPYNVVIVGAWQTNMYTGLYSGGQSDNTNRINIQQRIVSNIAEINPEATFTFLTGYGNSTSASSYTITEADQATIAAADAVIVVTGTDNNYSKEDGDRTSIVFSNGQATLISNVGKLNPRTIAVMETCGPMQVTEFENDVAAILWSSYLGNRKVGFGDVITGKVNPSGKTTDTWYQNVSDTGVSDIPSIYDYDLMASEGKQGRTYMYFTGTPSYPFGYGLSYTTFEYSNLTVKNGGAVTGEFDANDTITVSFDVTNTGSVKGKEVTQLYIAQLDAPAELNRPIKRLQGFEKIELEPGETKTVTLEVKIPDLAYYDEATDRFAVDTGAYEIQVGSSSADVPLKANINVTGAMKIVPAVLTAKPSQTGDEALGVEERLIFDKGKIVDPKLTVSMNDESLYGYIIKQQSSNVLKKTSTDFPEGMTFTYSSNRPSVVSVTDGVIRTEGPGVATITATATYNGVSVSTDFVVYVVSSNAIDMITVDGEPIPGFQKNIANYSIEVPVGTPTIPKIAYENTNEDVEVTCTQPVSIPGVATIVAANKLTGATMTYRVGIGYKPQTTDFKEGEAAAADKGWTFTNRNDNAVFGENGLTITTERGAFSNADYQPQNVFMQPALGDWVLQTNVKLDQTPTASNQQAGLIVYDDSQNYIRFVYERAPSTNTNRFRVYSASGGTETQVNQVSLASQTNVYFQIVKEGERYTFSYSTDGSAWTTFGTAVNANYALPQIGLYATNGDTDAAPISATYEKLSVFNISDLYPRLSSLSVNGVPVAGFDPQVYSYNVEVSENETVVPVLEATWDDPSYTVTYDQLDTPTGTASVTVSTKAASATYSVSFNTLPVSDYFADGTISPKWTILRENAAAYSVEKGKGLRLPTQRYDIYSTGAAWENVFVQPAMGNWEVVAKVFYPNVPTADYQQAMLLVWQDEDNYIRSNCQQSSLRYEPGREVNGSFSSIGGGAATANPDGTVVIYHRIEKEGSTYTISVSQDGENYTQIGNPITDVNYKDPKIGMFATQNSSSTPMDTYFEYITVTSINGVRQKSYQEMLQDAVDNVRDYVAAGIPATVISDIAFEPVPYGYTVSMVSSDPSVIAEDGKVTNPVSGEKKVTLQLTVSDGKRTSVSEPITVTVKPAGQAQAEMIMTGSDTVQPDSSFTVGIGIDTDGQDVYAEDITFSYDPAVFEYIETKSADENVINILRSESDGNGTVRIVAVNIGGINGSDSPLINVSFKAKSGADNASGTISITKANLGVMPNGIIAQATPASKTITVKSEATIDKSGLLAAITTAQALYDSAVVGTENGNYLKSDKDAFKAAIDAANDVYGSESASQTEVSNAAAALNTAIEVFKASVITASTGDINSSSTIDVGDLAIVAYYYGADPSSENWDAAKAADVNKDNIVDISDLAFIAARMLD
jgi:beta-glucosidase